MKKKFIIILAILLLATSGFAFYCNRGFIGAWNFIVHNDLTVAGDFTLSGKIDADYAETSAAASGTRYYDFTVTNTVDPAGFAEVNSGYFAYNKTAGSNGTYTINALEGVARSSYADEGGTFRGVYGRCYINADATSTMRTGIGGEFSARASHSTGTECVAESGTAFVGARIWMAPWFTAASLSNIDNFHGLWLHNEHTSNAVTNAIYVNNAVGGSWTNGINLDGNFTTGINMVGDIAYNPIHIGTKANTATGGLDMNGQDSYDDQGGIMMFCDDGGVALASTYTTSAIWTRYLITANQTSNTATGAYLQMKLKKAAGTLDLTTVDYSAIKGYIETDCAVDIKSGNLFVVNATLEMGNDLTNTAGMLAGIHVEINDKTNTLTDTAVNSSGILIRKNGSSTLGWPVGLKIEDNGAITGIDIGTCTTDIVGQNEETWENATTDGFWTTDGGITATTDVTAGGVVYTDELEEATGSANIALNSDLEIDKLESDTDGGLINVINHPLSTSSTTEGGTLSVGGSAILSYYGTGDGAAGMTSPTVEIDGTLATSLTNTIAGGEEGVNISISHDTNALTGTLYGVKSSARVNINSSGDINGGEFKAGNMTAGYDLGVARGVYAEVVTKIPAAATATWGTARGYEVSMDLDQGSAGHVFTITDAQMFYGVYNLPTAGTYATVTNGYGMFLRNEAVGGTGQMLDAALYVDDFNHGIGVYGWEYGIDFSGIGANSGRFGTADFKLSNGALFNNSTAALLTITEATVAIDGILSAEVGRTATFSVAASNSTALEIAQSDYQCDGTADEVQINAALTAAAAGGRVVLMKGTFTIVDPITFTNNNQVLEGYGVGTFIDGDGLATTEHGISITTLTGCEIKNLSIQTQDAGTKTCHAIFLNDGANYTVIDGITIIDSDDDGIHIEGTNATDITITNCQILDADGDGIFVDMDGGNTMARMNITNNTIQSAGGEGMNLVDYNYGNCSGNTISTSTGSGISVSYTHLTLPTICSV